MKAATLAAALQDTGAACEAHEALADTAVELQNCGARGQGLQTALVPVLRSDLALSADSAGSSDSGSLRRASAYPVGSILCGGARTADNSFREASAGALAVLLHDGSDAVREAAARQVLLRSASYT